MSNLVIVFAPNSLAPDKPENWKQRMQAYPEATDLQIWDVIENGLAIPARAPTQPVQQKAKNQQLMWQLLRPLRPLRQLSLKKLKEDELIMLKLDICFTALFLLLSLTEFPCVTAKAIWDRLQVMFKGTDRVRKTKMKILLGNYEMFEMKSDEGITYTFTRFTEIMNDLANQGKIITDIEKMNKLLRTLPKQWNIVKTSILETLRILRISTDDLIGTLMSYEVEHLNEESNTKGKKVIAFKADYVIQQHRAKMIIKI